MSLAKQSLLVEVGWILHDAAEKETCLVYGAYGVEQLQLLSQARRGPPMPPRERQVFRDAALAER